MLRLVALVGLATSLATAAPAQNATFYTASYVEVGPVLAKVGSAALHAYREAARKEPGVVILDAFQRIDQPNQFVILGAWTDRKAYDTHEAAEASKKLNEKLTTLLAAPVDIRRSEGIAASPIRTGKDPIIVVTHVDVLPDQKDNGANALEQLADVSRNERGNLRFDVWRQSDRPNHFTVVEAWANRGALDLHTMQKSTREFRMKLGPMIGALYDQRFYKPLQ